MPEGSPGQGNEIVGRLGMCVYNIFWFWCITDFWPHGQKV